MTEWEYNGKTEVYIQSKQGRTVLRVPEDCGALIASAPELLGALCALVRVAQARVAGDPAITAALDAIAKATGYKP
jgi:hypothetical protein